MEAVAVERVALCVTQEEENNARHAWLDEPQKGKSKPDKKGQKGKEGKGSG